MNRFAAANLLENPLILVVILLFGVLSSWLAKRRRPESAGDEANGHKLLSAPAEAELTTKPLNLEGILRQLLGGIADPQPLAPLPVASVVSNDQPLVDESKKVSRLPEWGRISGKSRTAAPGRLHRSHRDTRAVALVRDSRTVRQAFIASVVFSSPKALEDRQRALAGSD